MADGLLRNSANRVLIWPIRGSVALHFITYRSSIIPLSFVSDLYSRIQVSRLCNRGGCVFEPAIVLCRGA